MAERRTRQPVFVTQFQFGGQGRVLDRGVIHRIIQTRKVKAPIGGGPQGYIMCSSPLTTWQFHFIEYKGKEYPVCWETCPSPSPTGIGRATGWHLQLHADDPFVPDGVQTQAQV